MHSVNNILIYLESRPFFLFFSLSLSIDTSQINNHFRLPRANGERRERMMREDERREKVKNYPASSRSRMVG